MQPVNESFKIKYNVGTMIATAVPQYWSQKAIIFNYFNLISCEGFKNEESCM